MNLSNELKVGLAIIAAGLIFFFGLRFFQNSPLLGGTYPLVTRLPSASGLSEGSSVQINGVKVGEVAAIRLAPETDAVRVEFSVEDEYVVPEGSRTSVAGFGAITSVQLEILRGPLENPPIEPGGFVPSAEASAGALSMITERAPALISRADSVLLTAGSALEGVDAIVSDPEGDLRRTLAALQSTTASLNRLLQGQQAHIRRTLADFEAAAGTLRAFTDSTLTPATADSLEHAIAELNQTLTRLSRAATTLEATTERLNSITAKIDRGEGTLGLLVNDESLYVHLDSASAALNAVLRDLQRNPERYLSEMTLLELF